ncbi:hypothetical protein BAUCODRAFT_28806 [Baudoinia panamericana UAMH 10762]|uniref:Uncharacterized protein n=1 Tax=Baudoinia panamericana (strain UAMH 10762) TaxID=717646 RepID=M2M0C7_BAUPA|nr:uncharacterized protein BAUCODRAFT_28806 [Baudoinia panamericana UAMH 10762]EMD00453.1 hypothetical protein BAUCODRAFT_28806 [Baudoinia panamericana UAMH 10762]
MGTTKDSNTAFVRPAQMDRHHSHGRSVLGEVSPNVKTAMAPTSMLQGNKPSMGSPLKRTFNAMAENDAGFTYLKKRKMSDDTALSPIDGIHAPTRSIFDAKTKPAVDIVGFPQQEPSLANLTGLVPVPTIEEPCLTEPNTPSDGGDGTQDSSVERRSFSSLINYDPSSQPSKTLLESVSRAEMLKLRLRVALYKVRTNQVDIPFEKLRADTPESLASRAVEEAVAELRREAQERLSLQRPPVSKLLPGPVLLPTAYSSRTIFEPLLAAELQHDAGSRSPLRGTQPHGSQQSRTPQTAGRRMLYDEAELTSSGIKGRVAEGLLGLRNAV